MICRHQNGTLFADKQSSSFLQGRHGWGNVYIWSLKDTHMIPTIWGIFVSLAGGSFSPFRLQDLGNFHHTNFSKCLMSWTDHCLLRHSTHESEGGNNKVTIWQWWIWFFHLNMCHWCYGDQSRLDNLPPKDTFSWMSINRYSCEELELGENQPVDNFPLGFHNDSLVLWQVLGHSILCPDFSWTGRSGVTRYFPDLPALLETPGPSDVTRKFPDHPATM